jgi:spermidine synthase
VQPRELIGESLTPDGVPITLAKEGGGAYVIRIGGASLMSSRVHGSEEAMANVAKLRPDARVLVGGLGMGYTLRATLDALGPKGEVVVAELIPILVDWNKGPLASLAGHPLDDPRTKLAIDDVADVIRSRESAFDAILLDVDNAPDAFTVEANAWLYRPAGLAAIKRALRPGGALVVWSAAPSPGFVKALSRAGFQAEEIVMRARGNVHKGSRHLLYVGRVVIDRPRRSQTTEETMAKGQEKGAKGSSNKPKLSVKEKKAKKKAKAAK